MSDELLRRQRERDARIWEAGFDYADERRDDIRAREDNPYRGEA